MVILKFLTIYAFLTLVAHYFVFQHGCSKYLKYFPEDMQREVRRASWWQKAIVSIILTLPISLGILILIGQNIYFDTKILIIKLSSYRIRAFAYLYEKYPWYRKKLFRKKALFHISVLIFGRQFVAELVAVNAGCVVATLLLNILSNFNEKQKDESENIDPVSNQGASGEIS